MTRVAKGILILLSLAALAVVLNLMMESFEVGDGEARIGIAILFAGWVAMFWYLRRLDQRTDLDTTKRP